MRLWDFYIQNFVLTADRYEVKLIYVNQAFVNFIAELHAVHDAMTLGNQQRNHCVTEENRRILHRYYFKGLSAERW